MYSSDVKASIRLQGQAFRDMRDKLNYVSHSRGRGAGSIRVDMIHKVTKVRYHKWLNDEEIRRFKTSKVYNNDIYSIEEVRDQKGFTYLSESKFGVTLADAGQIVYASRENTWQEDSLGYLLKTGDLLEVIQRDIGGRMLYRLVRIVKRDNIFYAEGFMIHAKGINFGYRTKLANILDETYIVGNIYERKLEIDFFENLSTFELETVQKVVDYVGWSKQ